jgi:hypothetical protein
VLIDDPEAQILSIQVQAADNSNALNLSMSHSDVEQGLRLSDYPFILSQHLILESTRYQTPLLCPSG